MKFGSAKQAVAWAYEYCDLCRSPRSINYEKRKLQPGKPRAGYNHALRVLAIRILDRVGGFIPPTVAHETIMGYYIGWIRWTALTGKEQYMVRKTTAKIKGFLEDEGMI